MFSYTKEQTIHELGKIKVGGLPGQNPTLMIGSIFYQGQFSSPKDSKKEAEKRIREQERLAGLFSLNSLVDIFIYEKEEVGWKVDFALDNIDGFFSLDMPDSEVRMDVLRYLDEQGELDRLLYNSLNLGVTEEEIDVLEEHTPAAAVVLGYNPQSNTTQGRVDMIKNGGKLFDRGLLQLSEEIGIEYPILDTASTPFGEGASETLRSIPVFKSEFGLPVGCAMHNTIEAWLWLDDYEKKKEVMQTLDAAVDVIPIFLGADFVYYGPIENSHLEFATAAMADKLVAEGAEEYFGTEVSDHHPMHNL